MKKLTERTQMTLKGSGMIVYGILFIIFGMLVTGKWVLRDKRKIYEEINLSNFKGEVYSSDKFHITPQITIESPTSNFYSFMQKPGAILVYNNEVNSIDYISIKVYLKDSVDCGKYLWVKKSYENIPGHFILDYNDKKIVIYKIPSPCLYFLFFVLFVFCIVYGIVKIINNINRIKDARKYY